MLQCLFIASLFSAGTDEQSASEDVVNDNKLGSSVSVLITQLQVSSVSLSACVLDNKTYHNKPAFQLMMS